MAIIKTIGGFSKQNRYFFKIKIANELWSFSREDEPGEKQTQLFFVGWYTVGESVKLWSLCIPCVSVQLAINRN
jgi:hypothetical protein